MNRTSFSIVEHDVLQWARARQIIPNAKPYTQLLKAFSEMGELADAEIKGLDHEVEDAIGDVLVCLIIYCQLKDMDVVECLQLAYNTIKDRKGTLTPEGVFVKEQ
jgi:NTP pyrophosphatase (non-canonical NTP hydrolase)